MAKEDEFVQKYKILIVDDNDNNRLAIELLAEEMENVEIFEVDGGGEAIELCKNEKFDIIFMDIMMPKVDGFEATKAIKQCNKEVMIIALSALDDDASRNKMLRLGAEDYITKPLNSELFLQRLKNYLKIVSFRKNKNINFNAKNPFTKEVYSRHTVFEISGESSLVEFWDYWLRGEKEIDNLSDYVRIIHGFGLWMLKNGQTFTITCEENDKNLYFLYSNIDFISKNVVLHLLKKHLSFAKFTIFNNFLAFEIPKTNTQQKKSNSNQSLELSQETKDILSKTHDDKTSATEYVENAALNILPKLDALEIVEDELDFVIIELEKDASVEKMGIICEKLNEYCDTLALLVEFDHLVFALRALIDFLRSLDGEKIKSSKTKLLSSMLLNLLEDLTSWRKNIFIKQEAVDIHYLDASLLSSCIQIEALFDEKSIDEGDELEFSKKIIVKSKNKIFMIKIANSQIADNKENYE